MNKYLVTVQPRTRPATKHIIKASNADEARAIVENHFSLTEEPVRYITVDEWKVTP